MKKTITLTFSRRVENHVGHQQIGKMDEIGTGFNKEDIEKCIENLKDKCETELIDLYKEGLEDCGFEKYENKINKAYVLVIRNGVDYLLNINKEEDYNKDNLFEEQEKLETDKKAFIYGRVVNKLARHNLCFADFNQEPDYINKKGTIIDFKEEKIKLTNKIRENMGYLFDKSGKYEKANKLFAEGNYYYNSKKCGIGFHGDTERRTVIGIRLGVELPLAYVWYINNTPIGKKVMIKLNDGDIYIMDEKAVGTDWKTSSIFTLRHAAGCEKYLKTNCSIMKTNEDLLNHLLEKEKIKKKNKQENKKK